VSWLLLALQIALAVVVFLAAVGKALRSEEFLAALRLSHLPNGVVAPLGVAVPVVEFALAAALLLAPERGLRWALVATILLFALFTLWMGWVRRNRLRVRCGCFGPGGDVVGWRTIARNALLLGLALAALGLTGRTSSPLPEPSLALVVAVTSLAMCLALLDGLRSAWPHLIVSFDRLQAREAGGE
jgi:hypothetical protein